MNVNLCENLHKYKVFFFLGRGGSKTQIHCLMNVTLLSQQNPISMLQLDIQKIVHAFLANIRTHLQDNLPLYIRMIIQQNLTMK